MIHFVVKRRPQRRISSLNHLRCVIFSEWPDHHLDDYSAMYTIVVYKNVSHATVLPNWDKELRDVRKYVRVES